MRTTSVIMNDAMDCLIKKLGIVETEVFISTLLKEPFDYTEWQKSRFDDRTLDEICEDAVKFCKENPSL